MRQALGLSLVVVLSGFFAARRARAQEAVIKTIPEETKESDVDEVDEVDSGRDEAKVEREELSYSADEMRSRHNYALSLALGHAMPWQGYTVTAAFLVRPDVEVGVYGGGGTFHPSGIQNEKSYDTSIEARGFGVMGRYWFERLEKLSVGASLGYTTWNGSVAPHGSDSPDTDPADQLSAAFRATGLAAGASAALTWMWDSGLFIQWTPVGIESSRILQVDYSRDSDVIHGAVKSNLQHNAFYGLIDLEFGYFF